MMKISSRSHEQEGSVPHSPESVKGSVKRSADYPTNLVDIHIDDLAARHSEGRLNPDEQAEYGKYVSFSTFIAILKSKARQLLAGTRGA